MFPVRTAAIDTPFPRAYIHFRPMELDLGKQKSGPHTFGDRLRREREMRGVSLDEITAATRISRRFLLALENEHWEQLPGGVFNRGFIRSVSRYLGLDEEALLAEYVLATNDKPQVAVVAIPEETPRRTTSRAWIVVPLVAVLLIAAWFGVRAAWPLVQAWRSPLPELPPAAAHSAPQPPPSLTPSRAEPEALELKVDAGQMTSVKVIADGKPVFEGRISPGRGRNFRAKESFEISSENAGSIVLEMNGQLMPPMGMQDTPGQIRLTREDLKKARGGGN
jgi:cytoskeletal protein RodZ